MRFLCVLIALALGCGPPDSGPAPIAYGDDACDLCHMIISEAPYAAEARFGTDRFEKFDDIGCLAQRLNADPKPAAMWVADRNSGALHPVESVTMVHAADLKTPMASGVASFASRAEADAFASRHQGRTVTLEDVRRMRTPGR